jgi:DNA-binding CsgD family transcriptional regulator
MARRSRQRRRLTDSLANGDVEEIYDLLLRSREPTRATIREAGWSDAAIDEALELLHWRELVSADGPRLEVHPPDVALPAYATNLERQARHVRALLDSAQRAYAEARADLTAEHAEPIRRLRGLDEITSVAVSVEQRISTTMDAVVAGGPRLELVVSGVHAPIPDDRSAPVVRRALIATGALGDQAADADLSSRQDLGYDIRTATNLPFNLLIADRTTAVIDTTSRDPEGRGSMLVHDPVLVEWLCAWFDAAHRAATPLAASHDASGLDERDTRIFTLMAAGLTDAAIGRRLGVSTRTVERRTRRLMDHVDATTRFQAGVKAVRDGLI